MISFALKAIFNGQSSGHPPPAKATSFAKMFGITVYAFMCHHSLPAIVTPMRWVFVISYVSYTWFYHGYPPFAVGGFLNAATPLSGLTHVRLEGKGIRWASRVIPYPYPCIASDARRTSSPGSQWCTRSSSAST